MNPLTTRPTEGTMSTIADFGITHDDTTTEGRPPDPAQVATAQAYLQTLPRAEKGGSRWPGSYGLKHLAERWGAEHGMQEYVSNGALIQAARDLGIPLRAGPNGSPNARVGVRPRG